MNYVLETGLLYKKQQGRLLFVMTKSIRKSLVVVDHDLSGHLAVDKTMVNLLQDYWFAGDDTEVRKAAHSHMY